MVAGNNSGGVNIPISAEDRASAVFERMSAVFSDRFNVISKKAETVGSAVSDASSLVGEFGGNTEGIEKVVSALEKLSSGAADAGGLFTKLIGIVGPLGAVGVALGAASVVGLAYAAAMESSAERTKKLADRAHELAKSLAELKGHYSGTISSLEKQNLQFGMSQKDKEIDDLTTEVREMKNKRRTIVDEAEKAPDATTWNRLWNDAPRRPSPVDEKGNPVTRMGHQEEMELLTKGGKNINELDQQRKDKAIADLQEEEGIADAKREQAEATAAGLRLQEAMNSLRREASEIGLSELEVQRQRILGLGLETDKRKEALELIEATEGKKQELSLQKDLNDLGKSAFDLQREKILGLGLEKEALKKALELVEAIEGKRSKTKDAALLDGLRDQDKTPLQRMQDKIKDSGLQGNDLAEANRLNEKLNTPKQQQASSPLKFGFFRRRARAGADAGDL